MQVDAFLKHYGVKGMTWGKKGAKFDPEDRDKDTGFNMLTDHKTQSAENKANSEKLTRHVLGERPLFDKKRNNMTGGSFVDQGKVNKFIDGFLDKAKVTKKVNPLTGLATYKQSREGGKASKFVNKMLGDKKSKATISARYEKLIGAKPKSTK